MSARNWISKNNYAQNVNKNMLSLELFYYSFVIFIERKSVLTVNLL